MPKQKTSMCDIGTGVYVETGKWERKLLQEAEKMQETARADWVPLVTWKI